MEESASLEADKLEPSSELDKGLSQSISRRNSLRRSISKSPSGSRRSFTLSFGVPGPINIRETEEPAEHNEAWTTEEDLERRKKVSIWRLAHLNQPEIGVLLLGSVAAAIHGVVFPIFGLLLSSAIKMFYEPPHELRKDSRFWAATYVGMGLITFVAIPIQNFFFGIAGGKLIERIRYMTFQKVVHQEISWFDDPANSRSNPFSTCSVSCCYTYIVPENMSSFPFFALFAVAPLVQGCSQMHRPCAAY